MADTTLHILQRPGSAADSVPIKLVDNGDGTYALSVSGLGGGGGGGTAGEPIGLLLLLTKAS